MRTLKYSVLFFCMTMFLFSCDGNKDKSKVIVEDASSEANKGVEVTKIEFETTEFDFGKIKEGDVAEYVFKFRNVGDKPLVIRDARASCGCTIPKWTKDPVQPGEGGTIEVKFNSQGKSGNINKTVTVTANTDPAETLLFIKGVVDSSTPMSH